MDSGSSLDATRLKAVFYSLYFGGEAPALSQFAHCFTTSEIRTRVISELDDEGNRVRVEQTYTVFVPIEDMDTVYGNLAASLGISITEEQKGNRPHVQKLGTHGLFTACDAPLVLSQVAEEVAHHPGVVWLPIISLRREDAARLGYDNAQNWKELYLSGAKQTNSIQHQLKSGHR